MRGRAFDWFRTYLTERKKYVEVDSMFSTMKVIEFGIAQVSNFRPLLILLSLNDVSRSSAVLHFVNFADDTVVFLSHPISDALYSSFNEEFSKVSELLRAIRLSFNVDKTCYMVICNKKVEERKLILLII